MARKLPVSLGVSRQIYIFNGIFPLFKPKGITSANLLYELQKNILKEIPKLKTENVKLGHGGILDFSASGVLVVGAGSNCVKLKAFLSGDKRYRATAMLGKATDTYNEQGEVTMERLYDHIELDALKTVTERYLGHVEQVPPAYSALKHKGQLYADITRSGGNVELVPRRVQCLQIDILDFSPPYFSLDVTCGGGFYIRSLVHDIGLALDSCAHLISLERTRQGPFTLDSALREEDFCVKNVKKCIQKNSYIVQRYLSDSGRW